ncbi:FAD binding domain-containing protein [Clostridium tunisiense]|uniref:FAD binding domain-containing protein n=1 Tax=Clostridium tunisiense TaxID=219748 RepID=UPI0002E3C81C|nr:FAD binding domain-containing protein [Clostridium tunisiense]
MKINSYLRPQSLNEAYDELITDKNNLILGGGAYLKLGNRNVNKLIDLCDLNLNYIKEQEDSIEIGAMTTLRELEVSEVLKNYFAGILCDAVSRIMGVQLRNVATIGGTIGGRYGFSDFITALLALDTKVILFNKGEMNLEDFLALKEVPKDIITKIVINKTDSKAAFKDLRNTSTDFSILNVAVSRTANKFKIVIGARPGIARVAYKSMEVINNCENPRDSLNKLCSALVNEVNFSSDIRGSELYRKEVAKVLVKRALMEVL